MRTGSKALKESGNVVARSVHAAVDQATSTAYDAADRAKGAAGYAAEWLNEQSDTARAAQRKLLAKSFKYVAAHPVKSLGMALVAGILISKIAL